MEIVTLVEHANRDLGMLLDEATRFAVLLRHQLLVQRRDFDVEVVRRKIEVGRERLDRPAVAVVLEREGARFVLPDDAVEVEQLCELALGIVREPNLFVREYFAVDDALPGFPSARRRADCRRCRMRAAQPR
jgi:hypothetical protein